MKCPKCNEEIIELVRGGPDQSMFLFKCSPCKVLINPDTDLIVEDEEIPCTICGKIIESGEDCMFYDQENVDDDRVGHTSCMKGLFVKQLAIEAEKDGEFVCIECGKRILSDDLLDKTRAGKTNEIKEEFYNYDFKMRKFYHMECREKLS